MNDINFSFNTTSNQNAQKNKREERAIKIGKDTRASLLMKRRENFIQSSNSSPTTQLPALPPASPALFQDYANKVMNGNDQEKLEATKMFRRFLSQDVNPPNTYVIATGVLSYFVEFLKNDSNMPLQFEAAWALSNIASGSSDDTYAVVQAGAIDEFIRLLNSPTVKIQEQAIWGLANIAGDTRDYSYRDYILSRGVMDQLLLILNDVQSKPSLVSTAAWCLSNLCRGRKDNRPSFEIISKSLPTLARLINSPEKDVVIDACWAFSFIADGTTEHIDAIIELGIINHIVYLLNSPDFGVQTAALRVVVNIVAGNEFQTQKVLNAGILEILDNLLDSPSKSIKKEALWTLSNITAGTPTQIDAVLKEPLFMKVITILNKEAFEIQREACWTVCNAICGGTKEHINTIASMNVVSGISQLLLDQTEVRLMKMIFESLSRIFNIGEANVNQGIWEMNYYIDQFIECGGDDKLRELQFTDDSLYHVAESFIQKYFAVDEDEDENNQDYPSFPMDGYPMNQNYPSFPMNYNNAPMFPTGTNAPSTDIVGMQNN